MKTEDRARHKFHPTTERDRIMDDLFKKGYTYKEIGDRVNLSRQRCHQIISRGVRKGIGRPRKVECI